MFGFWHIMFFCTQLAVFILGQSNMLPIKMGSKPMISSLDSFRLRLTLYPWGFRLLKKPTISSLRTHGFVWNLSTPKFSGVSSCSQLELHFLYPPYFVSGLEHNLSLILNGHIWKVFNFYTNPSHPLGCFLELGTPQTTGFKNRQKIGALLGTIFSTLIES